MEYNVNKKYIEFTDECKVKCTQDELKIISKHKDMNGDLRGHFQIRNSFKLSRMVNSGQFDLLDDYNKKVQKWEVDPKGILLGRMSELDTCLDLLTKEEALAKIKEFKRESRIKGIRYFI